MRSPYQPPATSVVQSDLRDPRFLTWLIGTTNILMALPVIAVGVWQGTALEATQAGQVPIGLVSAAIALIAGGSLLVRSKTCVWLFAIAALSAIAVHINDGRVSAFGAAFLAANLVGLGYSGWRASARRFRGEV